ncbi:MAG TPA: cupin domain-containing protein [Pseudolysinimonas sp.]|jgi:quercetin dioxygenase-like cupin family protein
MKPTTKRNFVTPDATMDAMEKIKIDIVEIDEMNLMRVTCEPGWIWSVHSKPVQKTELCEIDHLFYVIEGQVGTRDKDGRETVYGPGDLAQIPPGHDGWTIGDEQVSWVEVPH